MAAKNPRMNQATQNKNDAHPPAIKHYRYDHLAGKVDIYHGDAEAVLATLPDASFHLIYIDPPFNTGRVQSRVRLKTTRDETGDRIGFQGKRYRSRVVGETGYNDSFDDYIGFLTPKLKRAYDLLTPSGALFFHIDYREAHYCKILLDEIFGRACFINEIIWAYDYGARSKRRWSAKHDTIFWYVKNPDSYTYNYDAIDRIPYMAPSLVGAEKAARGKTPTDVWWQADVWWQTIVSPMGKEKTGYPTQKPLAILDRIIQVHSNAGDRVLDFFAGSGTTGEAAARLGRDAVLVDKHPEAVEVMKKRFSLFNLKTKQIMLSSNQRRPIMPSQNIADPEVLSLAELSQQLQAEYQNYGGVLEENPFAWIEEYPPARKGAIGKELVRKYLATKDFNIAKSKGRDSDMLVNGMPAKVKFSTLWEENFYKFQQIRDQDYDLLIFLGVSPFDAHCWAMSKDEAMHRWEVGDITSQHGGQRGRDTAWLQVYPNDVQGWLHEFGGTLDEAVEVIGDLTE